MKTEHEIEMIRLIKSEIDNAKRCLVDSVALTNRNPVLGMARLFHCFQALKLADNVCREIGVE